MLYLKKNQVAYNPCRCCQCGVCLAACPTWALHKHKTSKQYVIKVNHEKCIKCGLCVKVCPAQVVSKSHISPDALENAKDLVLAYAKDTKVRKFASSGGVTRTVLQYALKHGLVNSVYTLLYPEALQDEDGNLKEVCREAEGTWLNTMPELFRIPCSLYRPVLWGENLRGNLPEFGSVLLAGLPCQLKAAKRILDIIRPKLDVLSIAIFCRKNKNFGYSMYFQKLTKVKHREYGEYKVTYRGGGWPGGVRVLSEKVKSVGYFYPVHCWNLSACRYCCDCTNMAESDLTVTDPWGIVKQGEECYGQNLVCVWTKAGRQLLKDCAEALTVNPVSVGQASISFDYNAIKKKDIKAQKYMKNTIPSMEQIRETVKAKLGQGILSIIPHTSRLFRVIQKVRRI